MTRAEYLQRPDLKQAMGLRLKIVGTPRNANLLGFTGLAFGLTKDDRVIVEEDGSPIIATAVLVSTN